MTDKVFLKVKLKTLAAEARIIRRLEKQARDRLRHRRPKTAEGAAAVDWRREQLHNHRKVRVRAAARNSHLAYAYLRGRTLEQVERTSKSAPSWKEVARMVRKYGGVEFDPAWHGAKPPTLFARAVQAMRA